jgi:TRAP-type uncharacterized transport system substrate-binding protein
MNKTYRKSLNTLMEYFDLGPTVALTIILVTSGILLTGIAFFIRSAPPTELTIISGPEGSIFHGIAKKYAVELKKNGIKVNILKSHGSLDNLKHISNPKSGIDLALVQSGSEDEKSLLENLVSLGGLSYQPLFFFYRGTEIERLTEMKGKTIAIGAEGSGGRKLALKLLKLNGIGEGPNLVTIDGQAVSQALMDKKIDGAFLMGEDASLDVLRNLLNSEDIHLMNFKNAAAYARKIEILHTLVLPEGILNFEKNIPPKNITLVAPMVELIATKNLHPALSDMILSAAMDIHGSAGIFKKRDEFPIAAENKIELSDDAQRFYQSGKGFLYRYLPYWLASLLNRILVVFVPMLIVLIPAVRSIPAGFRWMGHLRIRRRYRALLRIEEKFMFEKDAEKLKELYSQFETIDREVQHMRVKAIFADQFYVLRSHIDYVRKLMASKMGA